MKKILNKLSITTNKLKTINYLILSLLFTITTLIPLTSNTALAATPPDSCFSFNSGTNTIEDYYDNENNDSGQPACPKAVDIPSTIGGNAVTTIGNSAFYSNQLTSVTIPSSVTTISNYAFQYNQLTSVTIPGSVTTIGDYAFSSNQLTSVTIPSSVTTISNYAFQYNQLTSVTVVGNPTTLGTDILRLNPITSISYNGTTYTDTGTLSEQCFDFNSATGTINKYLFADLNLIKNSSIACLDRSVDIPSTIGGTPVTTISNSAFYGNKLTSITIPSSVTSIGDSAFSSNQLTSITIPSSVTTIGDSAFSSNQLTSITIPSSVTTIGDSAFSSNQLTSITIPSSVTTIGDSAFSSNQLTSITIPSSVTTIGDHAFEDNHLTSVTVVGNPTTLGTDILRLNPITSISYNGTTYTDTGTLSEQCFDFNSATGTINKYLFADLNLIKNSSIACLDRSVDIPSTIGGTPVTTISNSAFYGNKLTSITIPSSVTSIGDNAFYSNQLTSVTIPSSVTTISNYAFYGNKLTSITIPSSVTSIGDNAFSSNQLTSVTIGNGVASLDPFVFALNSDHTFADFELEMQQLEQQHKATWADPNNPTPAEQQAFMQEMYLLYYKLYTSAWYVQVYTADPSNPNNLQDASTSMTEADIFEVDVNGNGNTTDPVFFGGHLINPAYAQINYQDQSGNTISPSTKVTGYNTDNSTNLTTYLAKDNPTSNMSFYHKVGSTAHLPTPPSIAGYSIVSTPPSTLTLNNTGANEITYTYKIDTNSDSDSDGIPDSVETNAPNSGDANNDGIADSTQTNVTSYLNPVTNNYVVLQTSSECSITTTTTTSEDSLSTKDSGYDYPVGLTNFTTDCNTPGFTATINLYYYNLASNNYVLRKHNPNNNSFLTIANPTLTNLTIDNKPVTKVTYQVTDGQQLDIDNTTNGTIVDPVGLATLAVGSPNTGLR